MANDEFKYRLTIESTATGNGAEETIDAMRRVEAATGNVGAAQKRSQAEFEGLADKAKVSQFAFYDLDAEMRKTGKATETVTGGVTRLKQPMQNSGAALLSFSQGFEDLQYGIRGVLNNIPSLVLQMGGTAGLAGAISIAAVGLSTIIPLFTETKEKAAELSDQVKAVGDRMAEVATKKLDKTRDEIQQVAESAVRLRQTWDEATKADDAMAIANLENSEAMRQAATELNELLGIRVNKLDEIAAKESANAAKRKEELDQNLAAEQRRLADAQFTLDNKQIEFDNLQRESEKTRELLRRKTEELGELRAQQTRLENLANQTQTPLIAGDFGSFVDPEQAKLNEVAADSRAQAAAISERVDILAKQVAAIRDIKASDVQLLREASTSLQEAQNRSDDIAKAVATASESLVNSYDRSEVQAKLENIKQQGAQFAENIREGVSQVETNTTSAAAAKDSLLAAAADGKITADESRQVAEGLRSLIGALQSGQATMTGNVTELLTIQREFARITQQQQSEISVLRSQVLSLSQQRR